MASPLSLSSFFSDRERAKETSRADSLQRLLRAQELEEQANALEARPEHLTALQESKGHIVEDESAGFLERVGNILSAPINIVKNAGDAIGSLAAAPFVDARRASGALDRAAASGLSIIGNIGDIFGGSFQDVEWAGGKALGDKVTELRESSEAAGIGRRALAGEDPHGKSNAFDSEFTPWDAADTFTGYEDSEFSDWTFNDAVQSALWALEIGGDPLNMIGLGAKPAAQAAKNASRTRHIANVRTAKAIVPYVDGLADDAVEEIIEFASKNGGQFDRTALTSQLIKKGVNADEAGKIGKRFDELSQGHFQDLIEGSATELRNMHVETFGEGSKATKEFDQFTAALDKRGASTMVPAATFSEQAEVGQRSLRHALGLGRLNPEGRAAKLLDGLNQGLADIATSLNAAPGKGAKLFKNSSQEARIAGATAEKAVHDSIRQGANMASSATVSKALTRVASLMRYPTIGSAAVGAGIGSLAADDPLTGAIVGGTIGTGTGAVLSGAKEGAALNRFATGVQDSLRHGMISDIDSHALAQVEAMRPMISDGVALSLEDTEQLHGQIKTAIKSIPKSEQAQVQERIVHHIEAGRLTQAEKNRLVSEGKLSPEFADYQSLRNDEFDPIVREVAEIIGGDSEFLRQLQVANDAFVSQLDDVFDYFPRVPSRELLDLADRFPEVMTTIRGGRNGFFTGGIDTGSTKARKLRGAGTLEGNMDATRFKAEVNKALDGRATLKDVFETDVASVFLQQRRRAQNRIERARVLHTFLDNIGTPIQEELATQTLQGVKKRFQEALDDGAEELLQPDVVASEIQNYFHEQAVARSVDDTGRSVDELQEVVGRVSALSPKAREALERQVEQAAKRHTGGMVDDATPTIDKLADQVDLGSPNGDAIPPLNRLFEDGGLPKVDPADLKRRESLIAEYESTLPRLKGATKAKLEALLAQERDDLARLQARAGREADDIAAAVTGGDELARGTKVFDETVDRIAREFPDLTNIEPDEFLAQLKFMKGYEPMERARKAGLIRAHFDSAGRIKITKVDGPAGQLHGLATKHMEDIANDALQAARMRQETLIGKRLDANAWSESLKKEMTRNYGGSFEVAAEKALEDMTAYRALGDDAKEGFQARLKTARESAAGTPSLPADKMPKEVSDLFDHLYRDLEGKIDKARALSKSLSSIDAKKAGKKAGSEESVDGAKGITAAQAQAKLKRLEKQLANHRRSHAKLIERNDIRTADDLIEKLPQDAKISLVENVFKEVQPPEGHITALDALRKMQSKSAIPTPIEDIARLRTRFIPEAEVQPYIRFNTQMAPNGKAYRVLGKVNRAVKTGLLSAPVSIANEAIQQIIQYSTIAGGGGVRGMKWLGLSLADSGLAGTDKTLSGLFKIIGKEYKLNLKPSRLTNKVVSTIDGEVPFFVEKSRAARAGMFDLNAGIGESEHQIRSLSQIMADTNKGKLGKAGEALAKPFKHMVEFRERMENVSKTALYMTKREEGMSVRDAVNEVRKYFFDFNDVTKFERKHARNLVNFYTWAKKSAPMFARSVFEKPAKMRLLMLAVGAAGPSSTALDENVRGTYFQSLVGHKFGEDEGGNPLFLSMGGNPFDVYSLFAQENAAEFGRHMASRLNPLLKVGIEAASGVDTFTGRPTGFGDPAAAAQGYAADRAPSWIRYLPASAQQMLGFGEKLDKNDPSKLIKYRMDPKFRFLFENVLPLSAWSRSAEVALASDERKTSTNQRLGLLGLAVRSVPDAKAEAKLERQLRALSDSILVEAHKQQGSPFTVQGGLLKPNSSTRAGQKVLQELDVALVEAANHLEAKGIDINSQLESDQEIISDTILAAEQSAMNRFWPEATAKAEILSRVRNARDFLRNPEKVKARHEKKLAGLRERAHRARMAAMGVPSIGLKTSAVGRDVSEARQRILAR